MARHPPPRRVLVINSKGGSGKTTVATNLASLLALHGERTVLADLDPQQSSLDWARRRPAQLPAIAAVDARELEPDDWPKADYVVIDAPPGLKTKKFERLVDEADCLLVPLMPSPFDMDASARFLERLAQQKPVIKGKRPIGVIANRVNAQSRATRSLMDFIGGLGLHPLAQLRDSQLYVRAAGLGAGIADLRASEKRPELPAWLAILTFVRGGLER